MNKPITFFVGENGSGKSTLLEAIAVAYGFNAEGGTKNYSFSTYNSHSELCEAMTISKGYRRPKFGYFLRAESFYNVATKEIDYSDDDHPSKGYHQKSHGESFLAIAQDYMGADGVYIFDEPEAALSPQRQLTLLINIYRCAQEGAQFIIVSHSPILLGMPDAEIFSFDNGTIHPCQYEDTDSYVITKTFVNCGHCGAKLTLTSSRKWRKLSDGTLDDTLRVRYTCYGKLRKQTGCTGQTGYTVHILDEIIDKSVRQIFSKMRGIPKEQIITRRYEREVVERKNHLQTIQVERDKAQKDLISLKAEILACIKGESVFPKETLAEMITAQEEKLRELDALYESSYAETEKAAELMDNVSKLYEELISFSDLYDSASFEAKKMIVNQLIRRVDVYRGYQLNITFNFDLTPYIEGDDAAAC